MGTCADINRYFHKQLREKMTVSGTKIVQSYYAMAGERTLKYIQEDFGNANSHIRVLIATVAYGMGVNVHGVRRVVHWGGPKNAISYWQEVGRAGRDGEYCECLLFYIPGILRLVAYDEKLVAALRRMANLPTKAVKGKKCGIARGSQTETTYTDAECSEAAKLSEAQCAMEVKENPPCFRQYLYRNFLEYWYSDCYSEYPLPLPDR